MKVDLYLSTWLVWNVVKYVQKIITENAGMAERLTQTHSPGCGGCGWAGKRDRLEFEGCGLILSLSPHSRRPVACPSQNVAAGAQVSL